MAWKPFRFFSYEKKKKSKATHDDDDETQAEGFIKQKWSSFDNQFQFLPKSYDKKIKKKTWDGEEKNPYLLVLNSKK